ncbi:hypothetical protein BBJ28_00024540 [Nothophytophthora sp. Chile5]|nr:hypothetical protein BBJ28_00024540 [Nothophytophthora sp. Chile5]
MSNGYDGRTKGKRIRKPQAGNSNTKARWKYLSADITDVVDKPVAKLRTKVAGRNQMSVKPRQTGHAGGGGMSSVGYDIDGDGFVDAREMRLAKFLDAMLISRRKNPSGLSDAPDQEPTEAELLAIRQSAGRLLIAKEFVERNHERLWRYGSIFTGKDNDQAAEFIATHKNFQKLMPFLESTELNRMVRSSHQMRTCIHGDVVTDASSSSDTSESQRQTWMETTRKMPNATFSAHPLPALQPRKKSVSRGLHLVETDETELSDDASNPEVISNVYGAIDIDGDGIVDDDEMKLNLRLKEATHSNNNETAKSRHFQQLEGRKMMAKDFVQRNEGQMWLYDASFKHKSTDQIVDEIASNAGFATEFNNLRARERVVKLTSSIGVSGCLVQVPMAELPADPSNMLDFRRVKHRTELLMARKELLKPVRQRLGIVDGDGAMRLRPRGIREETRDMGRSMSEGCIGLPRIFDAPVRIEPTGSFSVTKWKLDNPN